MNPFKERFNFADIGNIDWVYRKSRVMRQVFEVLRSPRRHVVQYRYFVTFLEQPLYKVTADEPSPTGYYGFYQDCTTACRSIIVVTFELPIMWNYCVGAQRIGCCEWFPVGKECQAP